MLIKIRTQFICQHIYFHFYLEEQFKFNFYMSTILFGKYNENNYTDKYFNVNIFNIYIIITLTPRIKA